MNMNSRPVGHAGGTYTPTRWVRGSLPPEIWGWHALEVVPQRALHGASYGSRSPGLCGFCRLCSLRGTEGHDSPGQSARGHRRTR